MEEYHPFEGQRERKETRVDRNPVDKLYGLAAQGEMFGAR